MQAKEKSNEEKQAMAICEEVTQGQFIVSARAAFENRFLILEIIEQLQ